MVIQSMLVRRSEERRRASDLVETKRTDNRKTRERWAAAFQGSYVAERNLVNTWLVAKLGQLRGQKELETWLRRAITPRGTATARLRNGLARLLIVETDSVIRDVALILTETVQFRPTDQGDPKAWADGESNRLQSLYGAYVEFTKILASMEVNADKLVSKLDQGSGNALKEVAAALLERIKARSAMAPL